MDPHEFIDEEEDVSEMVHMSTGLGDHADDSSSSSTAPLTASGPRGPLSTLEFSHLNVYVQPSSFQGWCGLGTKAPPKHILRDIEGKLQVRLRRLTRYL